MILFSGDKEITVGTKDILFRGTIEYSAWEEKMTYQGKFFKWDEDGVETEIDYSPDSYDLAFKVCPDWESEVREYQYENN